MLKHIIAVLTASVSFAGCGTGTPTGQPHTVNRPVAGESKVDEGRNGAPDGQAGSAATRQPAGDQATGTVRIIDTPTGTGNTGEGTSIRRGTLDSGPPRDTGGQ